MADSNSKDFILHFCARRYLCEDSERYHITDLSKGAMLVAHAGAARFERYKRWFPLLQEELNLISGADVRIVAVGRQVAEYLERRSFRRPLTRVIHYSSQAAAARKAGIVGREREFKEFKDSISLDDLLRDAEAVLINAALPADYRAETLSRLKKSNLSESRRQLVFIYKKAFELMSHSRA